MVYLIGNNHNSHWYHHLRNNIPSKSRIMSNKKLQEKLNKILPLIFKAATLNISGNVKIGSAKLSGFKFDFNLDEIVYVEVTNKYSTIHLVGKKSKFIPYSIKKVSEIYPELIWVRKKGTKKNGPKSIVNRDYGFYNHKKDEVEIIVNGEDWDKVLIPSNLRKEALKEVLTSKNEYQLFLKQLSELLKDSLLQIF